MILVAARRAAAAGVGTLAAVGSLAVAGTASYLGVLTLAASSHAGRPRPPVVAPSKRFVILVQAHDEELVIGRALDAFRGLDYPADLFSVHVVADNCSDRTAEIVRGHGFDAHERDDRDWQGSGAQLVARSGSCRISVRDDRFGSLSRPRLTGIVGADIGGRESLDDHVAIFEQRLGGQTHGHIHTDDRHGFDTSNSQRRPRQVGIPSQDC
ncbi:MAG: hypothetical protein ABI862_04875 [Ilumatobacteraceae bacterium]